MNANSIVSHLLENWDNWEPTRFDIDWTAMHLARISDGGFWATSQGTFAVNHKEKVLTWSGPLSQIYQKVKKVAPHIGWRVVASGQAKPDETSFSA